MRRWIVVVAVVGLLGGAVSLGIGRWLHAPDADVLAVTTSDPSLSQTSPVEGTNPASNVPGIAGLDLTRVAFAQAAVTAPAAESRVATLTLDAELQHTADALMQAHRLPEAGIVMIDNETGDVLVYASHIDKGPPRDFCAEATAPAASVFKIVTSAALVEDAHLTPDTNQCYSGGAERVSERDLVDDPHRDKWCATLAGAMGRSINTIFARLAQQNLTPRQLEDMARRFGFGEPVPFDVPVQPSSIHVPLEPLEFARTAAGFWNTTLSPLEAAWMSSTVARGGEALRPSIVRDVKDAAGTLLYSPPHSPVVRRFIAQETAQALTSMMEHTISEGTSYRAFHDERGHAFLPDIPVAGKTGTLTDQQSNKYYSWFTGFAPSHATANTSLRSVSVAVLIINQPNWQVKANVIARDMLRAYFAAENAPRVTKPSPTSIARHHKATE